MKNLLLQHKNKAAFIFSFLLHAALCASFFDFSIKFSEVKSPEPLSILVYSPPKPVVKEVIEEKVEEILKKEPEITQIAPKIIKKPVIKKHKMKKHHEKRDFIKEIPQETMQPKENIAKVEENKTKPVLTNEKQGGKEVDELIAHIQATLNKEAQKNYPMSARKRRQQGIVKVGFIYDKGMAKHIKIISPSKYDTLNEAAIKSVRDAKFHKFERILDISVPIKFSIH